MSEDTYLIVDADNVIVNAVIWDGNVDNWQPPKGLTAHKYDGHDYQLGWRWDGAKPIDPNPLPPEPEAPPVKLAEDGGPDGLA